MKLTNVAVLLVVLLGGGFLLLNREVAPAPEGSAANSLEPVGAAAIDAEWGDRERQAREPLSETAALSSVSGDTPDVWSRLNDEAIAALKSGELDRAVELFERCMQAVPGEEVFARNLAEALARWARHELEADAKALEQSLAALERALELDPSRSDLRELLRRWKASLDTEREFWTDETAHFELSYDGQRTELLKHGYTEITRLLEDVYGEYSDLLNHEPVGNGDPRIRVLLYEREQFTRITGIGHWAGGAFDGTIRIPVTDYARETMSFERVLRHELVHAFVESYGGKSVPAWMNEGLAQWLENGSREARVQQARAQLNGQELFPMKDLVGTFSSMQDEELIARAYAQSFAFFDYIVKWYGDQLVFEMIRECGAGRSCEDTFRARTALELNDIFQDFAGEL